MAKLPTIEEMAQNVAEKALDEYEYNGKTLREWIEIISASELSTNLAEVGTDCISRQAAIGAIDGYMEKLRIHIATPNDTESYSYARGLLVGVINDIKQLPPIQPKRGKWIEYEQEFMLEEPLKTVQKTVKECSVCTAKIAGMVGIMNFCPNCGAKMEVNNEID